MAVDLYMKAGDRLPRATSTLRDGQGNLVDLTGATVTFTLRPLDAATPTVAGAAASIVGDPTAGEVEYAWAEGDTATPGLYLGEWAVEWGAGEDATFPSSTTLLVQIAPLAADAPVLDPGDLAWLRAWVGTGPTEQELAALVVSAGGRVQAALQVLRTRQADMLASPAKYKLPDQGEFDVTKNLELLGKAIDELEAQLPTTPGGDTPAGVLVGAQLVRGDTWTR